MNAQARTNARTARKPRVEGGQGATVRQLTTFVVLMALAVILMPVGSWAAQTLNVFITDPTNQSNRAHVDDNGNLLVRGGVNVNNLPSTQNVNVVGGSIDSQSAPTTASRHAIFNVPALGTESRLLDPIGATFITVSGADDDQIRLDFGSSFSLGGGLGPGNLDPVVSIPVAQPIPIDQLFVVCINPADPCEFRLDIVGV